MNTCCAHAVKLLRVYFQGGSFLSLLTLPATWRGPGEGRLLAPLCPWCAGLVSPGQGSGCSGNAAPSLSLLLGLGGGRRHTLWSVCVFVRRVPQASTGWRCPRRARESDCGVRPREGWAASRRSPLPVALSCGQAALGVLHGLCLPHSCRGWAHCGLKQRGPSVKLGDPLMEQARPD